jgi:WD40 repeat protein
MLLLCLFLQSVKNSVLMYSFDLDEFEATNDLKRLHATGKYKLAYEWQCEGAQSVTAFACLNSVESQIILAATSDRNLNVLDAVTGRISRTISGVHDRNVSCIALPQPSVHVPLPQHAYNTFATSAPDNLIMLWDVRSPSCVSRYSDHVNRRERVQCAFSPCMRYLATGSEDRTVRVFDITGGRELCRITGAHRDVVSSVAFHPIHPQLVSCSYDGTVKSFTCEEQ